MKICPTCQTTYTDDSNIFCLNDGTTLVDPQNLRQPQSQPKSSLPLVLAILAGFLGLAFIVGVVGLFLFTRRGEKNEEPKANTNTSLAENQNKTIAEVNANRGLSSVQIETNRASNIKTQASPPVNAPPRIVGSASSVRRQDRGNFYFPNFAFDNNPTTAWGEGAPGEGIGEWLNFEFDRTVNLRQIRIQPGYFKTPQIWRDNNRVSEALIEFSDGTSRTATFSDQMQTQTIDVGQKQTRWVRITIEDVYTGEHDSEDTLISEVSFVTEP
ncbi:MAG: discoidin domain-containing protein [Acidobacteriota bacterium]|nr:discoidin domain-containing protein [Acidobacteriota bacterium]